MRTTLLLRIASVLTFIHGALHEAGQHGTPEPGAQAAGVLAMKTNSFAIFGVTRNFWDFYRGMSLLGTLTMVAFAVLLWMLGDLAKKNGAAARPMIAAFAFTFLAMSLIAYKFLVPPPAVMELIIAAIRLRRDRREARRGLGMILRERLTATMEGDYVVFLIGMRINSPLRIHKWLPVVRSMSRMIAELIRHPELGFLHAESWFGRTLIMVQYWRSLPQLLAYAKDKNAAHLPAWREFNQRVGTDGSVGIWHETYAIRSGTYETVYVNMPPFGLGKAGTLQPATGSRNAAADRMNPQPKQNV